MDEDPRYLRNQSRAIHRLHRRNTVLLRWFMILWLLSVTAWTAAALLDVGAGLGWGFEARHAGFGLLLAAGGCAFWLFGTLIGRAVLGIARRMYGPEPAGPMES